MYEHGGLYMNDTEEITNAAWDAINYDSGNVALDDAYVAMMGLPLSQRFPWDSTKGLYFMNGQHQIHCLVRSMLPMKLRGSILIQNNIGINPSILFPVTG